MPRNMSRSNGGIKSKKKREDHVQNWTLVTVIVTTEQRDYKLASIVVGLYTLLRRVC